MAEENNDGIILLFWFGFIVNYCAYHIKRGLEGKKEHGVWWSKERSAYYKPSGFGGHQVNWFVVKGVICRTLLSTTVMFPLYFMMKYAILAGVSTAVINSIICCTSFITALMFYIFFRERLSGKHFVGMCLLMISVGLISSSDRVKEATTEVIGERAPVWIPVGLAITCSIIYALSTVLARVVIPPGFIKNIQFQADAFMLYSFILVTSSLLWHNFV
jgi:drug/metabolite transporter (DMT)-like permease